MRTAGFVRGRNSLSQRSSPTSRPVRSRNLDQNSRGVIVPSMRSRVSSPMRARKASAGIPSSAAMAGTESALSTTTPPRSEITSLTSYPFCAEKRRAPPTKYRDNPRKRTTMGREARTAVAIIAPSSVNFSSANSVM